MSPRASESALPYTHQVYNGLTIMANDRTLNLTRQCIGAKYTVIWNWVVLPYIEQRVSHATRDAWIPSSIHPDTESVVEPRVDSYKSIQSTGLQYIDHWLMTYLSYDPAYLGMPW